MSQKKWFTIGVAISLSAATFAKPTLLDEPWADYENPSLLAQMKPGDDRFVPETGADHFVKRKPWSGHWWPTFEGGVAFRWNHSNSESVRSAATARGDQEYTGTSRDPFKGYGFYSMDQLAEMDQDQIYFSLSPIEKLDVIAGRADSSRSDYYFNTKTVRTWVGDVMREHPEQRSYHGICAGFSNAAAHLAEPLPYVQEVTYRLSSGEKKVIRVIFGSGDLKALAAWFYAQKLWAEGTSRTIYEWIGPNANETRDSQRTALNAGSFHLLLSNIVAKKGETFVVDVDRRQAVWNYPVAGYSSQTSATFATLSANTDPRAVKEVEVRTNVYYVDESDPRFLNYGPNNDNIFFTRKYHYRLELTADNRIVGGTWLSGSDLPDFAWRVKKKLAYEGDFVWLNQIWQADPKSNGKY